MILHDRDFGYTHNLDYLLGECAAIDKDFSNLDMKNMNLYAVRARYPHDHLAPDMSETREYYQIAISIQTLVKRKMIW